MLTALAYHGKTNGRIGTWKILLGPSRIVKKVGEVSRLETRLRSRILRRIRFPKTRIGADAKSHHGEGCEPHRLSEIFEFGNKGKHEKKKVRTFWLWIKGRIARLGQVRAPSPGTCFRSDGDREGHDQKSRPLDFRQVAKRNRGPSASGRV